MSLNFIGMYLSMYVLYNLGLRMSIHDVYASVSLISVNPCMHNFFIKLWFDYTAVQTGLDLYAFKYSHSVPISDSKHDTHKTLIFKHFFLPAHRLRCVRCLPLASTYNRERYLQAQSVRPHANPHIKLIRRSQTTPNNAQSGPGRPLSKPY